MFFFVIMVVTIAVMGTVISSSGHLRVNQDSLYDRKASMLEASALSLVRAIEDYKLDNFESLRSWQCIEISGVCTGDYERVVNESGYGVFTNSTWDLALYPNYIGTLNIPSEWDFSVEERVDEVYACFYMRDNTATTLAEKTRIETIKRFYERANKRLISIGDTNCSSTTPMVSTDIDSLNHSNIFLTYKLADKDF